MAKKNYSAYSKKSEEKVEEVVIENEVAEVVEEPSKEKEEAVRSKKSKVGVVTNCLKLNVRKEPKATATVVCEIECLSEVVIDDSESTDEFYKVFTASGVEGYCMKKYVAVRQ